MKLILQRLVTTEDGTFGVLTTADNQRLCVTLEEPWVDANADGRRDRNVSRIAAGTYKGFRRFSPKRQRFVPELRDVPDASNIQIHIGNTLADIEGCILVGMRHGRLNGVGAVLRSREAFDKLMALLFANGAKEFELEVRDHA